MANRSPIRCFEGDAQPGEAFWAWKALDATKNGDGSGAELDFLGYISEFSWMDDAVTPKKFAADLKTYGKGGPITIRMHSGGGEVFAAGAIAAMLSDYPGKKTVVIEGLCASAAVMVALSADRVKIHDTAYMMVHNPGFGSLFGWLDAETLKKMADQLETFTAGMLDAYVSRTGMAREELAAMLDAETWMTAAQAVEKGFADEVIGGGSAADAAPGKAHAMRQSELVNFVNVPGELLAQTSEAEQLAAEIERDAQALRDEIDLTKEKI